jgi:hypothetical protein
MALDVLSRLGGRQPKLDVKILAGLAIAAAIAWWAPFDLAFGAATLGLPAFRSAAILLLAISGLALGRSIGLQMDPPRHRGALATPLMCAALVAVWCLAVDWLMRTAMSPQYVGLITSTPTAPRVVGYALRAFNENIMYRLFLGSLCIRVLGLAWKAPDGRPATGAFCTGFVVAQCVNIWINVTSLAPLTPFGVAHDALRFVAPALVWAWLYWKRGFQSCEIACTSVHLFLQPLLTAAFA